MNKHCFALYYEYFSSQLEEKKLTDLLKISDKDFLHRLAIVLRASAGDEFLIFDARWHARVIIEKIDKKEVFFSIQTHQKNRPYELGITYWLPLLRRDALFEAVYALAEAGVSAIQLVQTSKSSLKWHETDLQKLRATIIAACEQSKNFNIPSIEKPIQLQELITVSNQLDAIFCDPAGKSFFEQVTLWHQVRPSNVILISGPEADLSQVEKELLHQHQVLFTALTPTILRAKQVPGYLTAMIRSLC